MKGKEGKGKERKRKEKEKKGKDNASCQDLQKHLVEGKK